MPVNVSADLERGEALLWSILCRFETLAVDQYATAAPALLTPEKAAVVALLQARAPASDELAGTRLDAPLAELLRRVRGAEIAHVLVSQGLFLECIGAAIYRTFGQNAGTSETTRVLCERGVAAGARALDLIPGLLREHVGSGDALLQVIIDEAGPLLGSLDDLGDGIDAYYLDRYGVSFADLMGDVAAELLALCLELDVDRRKFVAFLTSALMGA